MIKYAESHEWVKVEEGYALVGISQFAEQELGPIVYIELPKIGKTIQAGEEVAVLESTKSAVDIYSPLSGEIVEINESIQERPGKINSSPEDEGWLFKLKISKPIEYKSLMDILSYKKYLNIK